MGKRFDRCESGIAVELEGASEPREVPMTDFPVQAVTLDLDGTLVEYNRSPAAVLEVAFEQVGVDPLFEASEYYDRYETLVDEYESMAALRQACFSELAVENGFTPEIGQAVADAFAAERDHRNVTLLPGVSSALDRLASAYRLVIITNGMADAQRAKIEATELAEWVETVVIAGAETRPKPDSEPFERALESLDVSPESAVHIGDSLTTDIAGAHAAGLRSVWVSTVSVPQTETAPTYQISGLDALFPLPWERD